MKPSRRHQSLIPLSREHQYGLLLCLRIHRGLPLHGDDEAWVGEKAAQAAQFIATDLAPHFRAEEEAVFPAMKNFAGASELISALISEHRKLEAFVERLHAVEATRLVAALVEFADLLESHIRKEERQLFPIYETQISPDLAAAVERAVKGIIGEALEPRSPQLLR